MKRLNIGIVNYEIGNYASLQNTIHQIGYRCQISHDKKLLNKCDILLLPGVGAFRPAMEAIKKKGLDSFLVEQARHQRPILGICLGMQLLSDGSYENGYSKGLGLIPGEIIPLKNPRWHIGWNNIKILRNDSLFESSNGKSFYFNHSHTYQGPTQYQVCKAMANKAIVASIRRQKVLGIQFHPEKSQLEGKILLKHLLSKIDNA